MERGSRRGHAHSEVDTEGSWAISYGDMITLLLTFFILFFSTDQEKDRMQTMQSDLLAKLNARSSLSPQLAEQEALTPEIQDDLAARISARAFKAGQKLIVEFEKISFYGLGEVELTAEGRNEIDKFMKIYLPYAGNYLLGVRAYTDNKKVRAGAFRYQDNLELSALRAIAAMRWLRNRGMPLERMRLGGYGELFMTARELERAIASAPDYARKGLPEARKVVFVIEPEPKENP